MATTKQVIRIEHPFDKQGLFHSKDKDGGFRIHKHSQWNEIEYRHSDMSKFPTYCRDQQLVNEVILLEGNRYEMNDYRFAFHSLEVLNEALTSDELKECINVLGYKVYMIEVTRWLESEYQVIFKPENIIDKKDISFLFI